MTKLDGPAGQLFSGIAEAINVRGTTRSGKGARAQASGHSAFRDVLHTASNPPRRASRDQDHDGSIKPGMLRARVALLTEFDKTDDETAHKLPETPEKPDASRKSVMMPDHAATADVQDRLTLPSSIGQQFAAIPVLKPQAQTAGADEEAVPARKERSSTTRELPGTSAASAMKDAAESGSRPSVAVPQRTAASQGDATPPQTMSTATSFETVAATIERAAKPGSREALPEATKVTVVQQETHLPPVQPFPAAVQVAKAMVSELEGSPAPPSSAASNPASAQGNVPDQPLKILTISLEPPALGNVTVRLRLVGAAVSVHLAADRRETSQMLDQQRDSIRELMQSAGFVADVAPVQHGALDGFQPGSSQSQPSFSGQQQPQGAPDGSNPSSGQSQDGAKQPRKEQQTNQETRHDQDVAPHHRRGAVYL
jgi:chemotaxis protein MotD